MREARLGQSDLDARFGDADVGGRSQFQATAKGMAGQRRHQRHAQARQSFKGAMAEPRPVAPHFKRRQVAPGGNVAACAERLALARQDGGADIPRLVDRLGGIGQRDDHLAIKRVELVRALQREPRDRPIKGQANPIVSHSATSMPREGGDGNLRPNGAG